MSRVPSKEVRSRLFFKVTKQEREREKKTQELHLLFFLYKHLKSMEAKRALKRNILESNPGPLPYLKRE